MCSSFINVRKFIPVVVFLCMFFRASTSQCLGGQSLSFVRWSGVNVVDAAPVFVYTASGEEESLVGACLARCRELEDCDAVLVAQAQGNCHGVADKHGLEQRQDGDIAYFKKTCLDLTSDCSQQWWAIESTPGYSLHSENSQRVVTNTTLLECYHQMLAGDKAYRSAQWVGPDGLLEPSAVGSPGVPGTCVLSREDKFSEPESYRVSNYYTIYIENQCRHDYPKKIDRCSYEEYYNQTLKHVDFTLKNHTKDECKSACEVERRFVCRGFSWTERRGRDGVSSSRGLCDLHSEDLVTTGSWLLRRNTAAVYYRRVICLNITVECDGSDMTVTYRPHGSFRGRVYVPGRGEQCSARAAGKTVRLTLPLHGDCDVNFAYAISNTPAGVTNRTMAYVMVMIQNNPIIQTAGDRWVRVGCSPGPRDSTHSVDATLAIRDTGKPTLASEALPPTSPAAASAVFSPDSAPLTMYVVRADDSAAGSSAVSLGEPLELRIETTGNSEIEAYHLVASSRLGDSSVLLLDSRGCSTGQVDFPPFTRSWAGGTQRLAARFKAFRFPSSHVVRFALMVRFCEIKCQPANCGSQSRLTREANVTYDIVSAAVVQETSLPWERRGGVVAQGGSTGCGAGGDGRVPLEVEMVVGARDILSADTLVRADHRAASPEEAPAHESALVCVHELLLVALALAWLAVQVLLLLGCCILVKRYRNLAELSMQKDYQSFDNVGFDTVSTHRRVHWPDQNIDILHTT